MSTGREIFGRKIKRLKVQTQFLKKSASGRELQGSKWQGKGWRAKHPLCGSGYLQRDLSCKPGKQDVGPEMRPEGMMVNHHPD